MGALTVLPAHAADDGAAGRSSPDVETDYEPASVTAVGATAAAAPPRGPVAELIDAPADDHAGARARAPGSQRVALYSAQPLARHAWHELRALVRYRQLVVYLVSSTLNKERANRVFGYFWWVLDPLLMMAVYVLLVDVILRRGGEDYPLFVFSAVLVWKFFSSGVATAMSVTIGKERLMRQIAFPRTVLPVSAVAASTIHFAFGLVVFLVAAVPFGVYPSYSLAFLPAIAAAQLAFTLGVAFFAAALNVFFRDLQNLTAYVFRLWFYLSPGLYAVSAVPREYRDLYELNPFATFFTAYRDVLIDGDAPELRALGVTAAASMATLALGYAYFVRRQAAFAKVR